MAVVPQSRAPPLTLLPWIAHFYTALGAVLALGAAMAIDRGDFRTAFLAMVAATFIDATDGWLARTVRVKERLPHYDGARLDDIVDYLTYVFVPVLLIGKAGLLPGGWELAIGGAVLLASAYGFGQGDAKVKTDDHYFTGFPSYWNIVALYLFVWGLSPRLNAAVLLAFAALVFVPIRYVYPSRTEALKVPTIVLGGAWALLILLMVWRLPALDGPWMWLSLVFPGYYFLLSAWLQCRR
ncbi:MAG: CDP-alcohol phosphatidyltransferase family protein [Vicinamibacterales bacterium]